MGDDREPAAYEASADNDKSPWKRRPDGASNKSVV